uniref:Putative terminase n=1 Tax=viral metagenome TaxID=1070528 RepID=A0A6M3IF60_9ZZZZ
MTTSEIKPLNIKTTKVFLAILRAWEDGKKGILLEGGTYSSKTFSALQFLFYLADNAVEVVDENIVSESVPHLKGGCIKDYFKIIDETVENNSNYNQTDHIYHRANWKGAITFLSADNEKALGMRRDVLFINEGDTLSWETARELISRTNIFVIIDWNPRSEFWAHEYFKNDPEWAYDHSTYLDALDVIPVGKRDDIESLGSKDPNYNNIYVLGLLGKVEGLVHPFFAQVVELPDGDYFYGLDFGYGDYNPDPALQMGGDPTVLIKNVIIGENLYSKEMFYKREPMTNDDIAREMELLHVSHNDPIYPDPNEPKSAEEIRRKGFNVQETEKGPGSVAYGIKKVNQFYQHWTQDSLNCIKEQRNFHYIKRKELISGRVYLSEDTTHQWSHGMSARRYGAASFIPIMSSNYPSVIQPMGRPRDTKRYSFARR